MEAKKIDEISEVVSKVSGYPVDVLKNSRTRVQGFMIARGVIVNLLRHRYSMRQADIGRIMKRDRSTLCRLMADHDWMMERPDQYLKYYYWYIAASAILCKIEKRQFDCVQYINPNMYYDMVLNYVSLNTGLDKRWLAGRRTCRKVVTEARAMVIGVLNDVLNFSPVEITQMTRRGNHYIHKHQIEHADCMRYDKAYKATYQTIVDSIEAIMTFVPKYNTINTTHDMMDNPLYIMHVA